MHHSIGIEPDPVKGLQHNHLSKSADGRSDGNGVPVKPRSNTVATFLRPQLSSGNMGEMQRSGSSTVGHSSINSDLVQDRRHGFLGNPGIGTADLDGIRAKHGAFSNSVIESTSRSLKEFRNSRPTENSVNHCQQTGCTSRRFSATERHTGSTGQHASEKLYGAPRDAQSASVTRGEGSVRESKSPHIPPFESFAAQKSSRPVSRETYESKDLTYASRGDKTASDGHKRHFDSSAHCRNSAKTVPAAVGLDKAKETENIRVGFTVPSERERHIPTSYLMTATRTRESLLVPGEGRAYHLGVQHGELHNRILTVGHAGRADWLAERFLDPQMRTLSLKSNRNFRLHSGYYRRKPVSIVAVGMGAPMMDVLVREASYITDGPLAIVRLGTCTLLDQEMRPGSIVVASPGSLGCYTNYAYFDGTAVEYSRTQEMKPYIITRTCAADPELSRLIYRHVASQDPDSVYEGLNVSAETFYSCQAREDQLFKDENDDLLETLLRCGAQTMEMETHQLFHLASRRIELMKAAAVHIGVTSRTNDHFMHPITPSQLNELVSIAGRACLDALVDVAI